MSDPIPVQFLPMGKTVQVDPDNPPDSGHGLPGSILEIALAEGIPLEHACGGVCACATCHVVVKQGAQNLSEPSEEELDLVDQAPACSLDSRLACQAVPKGPVTVYIPEWNRNAVKESEA
jgi:2Fe-2S ferredoxin